jgi:hypothetical protein
MGFSLVNHDRYCFNCNRLDSPNVKIESANHIGQIELCFVCIDLLNDTANDYVNDLISGKSFVVELNDNAELLPNLVIEFEAIEVKDSIQLGDRIEYIHFWNRDKTTLEKKIGFMVREELTELTQAEYISQGWRKVVG